MTKHNALYLRVSSDGQNLASQEPELTAWAAGHTDLPTIWYEDQFTGKTMNRPGWNKLEAALRQGRVASVVVWRLDRLGRTAKELTALIDDLVARKVNLVSMREGIDISTPAGRMIANVLASIAQFETEVRAERQHAGIAAARAKGKTWGGSKPGVRKKVTAEKALAIRQLHAQGTPKARIAQAVGLSRPTVYDVLAQQEAAT